MTRRLRGFLVLLVTAAGVIALLAGVNESTRDRVESNRTQALWRHAETLAGIHDLHLRGSPPSAGTTMLLPDGRSLLFGSAEGYGGIIHFIVLIDAGRRIAGIVVTSHLETPGIADFISDSDSDWMRQFIGRSGRSINAIDGRTGATITTEAFRRGIHTLVNNMKVQP